MYVRAVNGRELTLQVGGKLWRDALVMIDRETGTHWSQIDGRAFRGELAGETLEVYPSEITTWKEWTAAHPGTRVLRKEFVEPQEDTRYRQYFDDPERLGIFGRRAPDDRLPPKTVVLAVTAGRASKVYPVDSLATESVRNDQVGEVPVVLARGAGGGWVVLDRRVDGETVVLREENGALVEASGVRRWRLPDGAAGGDHPSLVPVRSHVVFWFAWASFFPGAAIDGEE